MNTSTQISGSRKKILYAGIGIVVILGFLYFYSSGDDDTGLTEVTASPVNTVGSIEVVRLLSELQSVSFAREVLSSPVFAELADWSVTLTPETPGRENPFAPIGIGGAPVTESIDPEAL